MTETVNAPLNMPHVSQKETHGTFLRVPQSTGSYEFHVRDFELLPHGVNQKYLSHPFTISGKDKWDLTIIPGGKDNDLSRSILVDLRNLDVKEWRASCSLFLSSGSTGLKFVASTDVPQLFGSFGSENESWTAPLPFSFQEAIKNHSEFLINGEMIVVAKMTICGDPEFLSPDDFIPDHQTTSLAADLEYLLSQASSVGSMKYDIVLVSGDVRIPCHQCILSCRSRVFRESFLTSANAMKLMLHSGKNVVNKIHSSVLREFVHFLYTDECRPEFLVGELLQYMFSAACKYQVLGLMSICEKSMANNITVANAANYLALADGVGAKSLKQACLKFIANHTTEVIASEGYGQLDASLCRLILDVGEVTVGSLSIGEDLDRSTAINPAATFSSDDAENFHRVQFSHSDDIVDLGSLSHEAKSDVSNFPSMSEDPGDLHDTETRRQESLRI